MAKDRRQAEEQRHHGEADQRQLPALVEQDDDDPGQGEDVADHGDHPRGERLLDRLDVGGHPGHQPADRVAMEEAHRQGLDVVEGLLSDIAQRALAGVLHQVELEELEEALAEDRGGEGGDDPAEALELPGDHVLVDGDLQDVRL